MTGDRKREFSSTRGISAADGQPDALRRSLMIGLGGSPPVAAAPWWATRLAQANMKRWLVDRWVDDCGPAHNGVNMWWAKQCELLPCFKGVAWPSYAEKIIFTKLDGISIVIHLWKGYCQKFGERDFRIDERNYPGGAGAEVGIYRIRDQNWITLHTALKSLEPGIWHGGGWFALLAAGTIRQPKDKWYPAPELKPKIRFRLLDPENGDKVVLDTKHRYRHIKRHRNERPEDFYWCTEWLERHSYEKWEKSRPQYEDHKKTFHPLGLTLDYEIVGGKGGVIKDTWVHSTLDHHCTPNVGCKREIERH